jgi:hypothetical protein
MNGPLLRGNPPAHGTAGTAHDSSSRLDSREPAFGHGSTPIRTELSASGWIYSGGNIANFCPPFNVQDCMRLNHLLRSLRRSPMFAVVTLIALAIGIGANTAIFSVLDGVLLKPLPYPRAEQLISIDHAAPGVNLQHTGAAPFLYYTYREQNRTLQDAGMWQADSLAVTGTAEPQQVDGIDVTQGVLPILGVQPFLGRLFTQADDAPGAPATVILSYAWWQTRFGGDRSAIGRTIVADGQPREIIGVLPERFRFLDRKPALFTPMQLDRAKTRLGNFSYQALARLKPGVTLARPTPMPPA